MDTKNGFTITNRDHVLRAWQNSTELVLEEDSSALAKLFSEFAEDEAEHAAKLLDLLRRYEK